MEISQRSRTSVTRRALAQDLLGVLGTMFLLSLVIIERTAPLGARVVAAVTALGTAISAVVMLHDYRHRRFDPVGPQTVQPLPLA